MFLVHHLLLILYWILALLLQAGAPTPISFLAHNTCILRFLSHFPSHPPMDSLYTFLAYLDSPCWTITREGLESQMRENMKHVSLWVWVILLNITLSSYTYLLFKVPYHSVVNMDYSYHIFIIHSFVEGHLDSLHFRYFWIMKQ